MASCGVGNGRAGGVCYACRPTLTSGWYDKANDAFSLPGKAHLQCSLARASWPTVYGSGRSTASGEQGPVVHIELRLE